MTATIMATDEAAFLAAIAASPDDPLPRLVFADWLGERGDPREAGVRWRANRPGGWRDQVVALATTCCAADSRLFRSRHGRIVYGHGGQEEASHDVYSKAWHRNHGPYRWRNAGAVLDDEDMPTAVIVRNYRNQIFVRLPWPPSRPETIVTSQ